MDHLPIFILNSQLYTMVIHLRVLVIDLIFKLKLKTKKLKKKEILLILYGPNLIFEKF